jgi:hypothetical protein
MEWGAAPAGIYYDGDNKDFIHTISASRMHLSGNRFLYLVATYHIQVVII